MVIFDAIKERLTNIEVALRAVIIDRMNGVKLTSDDWMELYNTMSTEEVAQ